MELVIPLSQEQVKGLAESGAVFEGEAGFGKGVAVISIKPPNK